MYEVIADPPVSVGAVKVTVAWPFPRTALAPVGAPGLPAGVTEEEVARRKSKIQSTCPPVNSPNRSTCYKSIFING